MDGVLNTPDETDTVSICHEFAKANSQKFAARRIFQIRNHPIEVVGRKLRAYMTAMKPVV